MRITELLAEVHGWTGFGRPVLTSAQAWQHAVEPRDIVGAVGIIPPDRADRQARLGDDGLGQLVGRRHIPHFSEPRDDIRVTEEVLAFITEAGAKSVVMTDRIIGCPHEEGIDYEGATCPACPFWAGRDRWTGERLH